ncbi:hypothetical protein [Levilactobacillus phage ENFP1]|nr:hypothetical protein [Levilactobacillus phage ENFP1]
MTASENLQQLWDNDELTEAQQDNMMDFNVYQVADARDLFKEMLNENTSPFSREATNGLSDADIITTLYNLLKYSSVDYVICDGYNGIVELLDNDTLDDILDV